VGVAATIYDVARRAGVTAATVSNVVRGKGSVGAETRTRVRAAVEDLDYRPNLVARGLARRRSCTLALLLPNIANPFYPEIALEVERIAGEQGYHLLLCNTRDDAALGRAHLHGLSGRWVDGVLAMAGGLWLADVREAAAHGLPIVLCNWGEQDECQDERGASAPTLPRVDVDFRHGGELAARHLLERGHRRVAVIVQEVPATQTSATQNPSHTRRLEGVRAALGASGAALAAVDVGFGDGTLESGYRAAARFVSGHDRPTAIFATNDMMALGAMEAAADAGLSVPDDLSLIGFDDIALAGHVRPALTTIAIPKRELAIRSMDLLLRHVDGAVVDADNLAVRPHLVIRHSTAAYVPL